ncbi:MAG: hypothetical protein AAGB26_01895 [Planctomycetota bacterium]
MKRRLHPTFNRKPLIAVFGYVAICLFGPSLYLNFAPGVTPTSMLVAIIAITVPSLIVLLVWIGWYHRQCACPTCGETLKRSEETWHNAAQFPCDQCATIWVSSDPHKLL